MIIITVLGSFVTIGAFIVLCIKIKRWLFDWTEQEKKVGINYPTTAVEEGKLKNGNYRWFDDDNVESKLLRNSHKIVYEFDKKRKIKYKLKLTNKRKDQTLMEKISVD